MIKKLLLQYFPKEIVKIICTLRDPIYIGKKGYTVSLKQLTENKLKKVKEDLTFKPFRPKGYGPDAEPFSVFGISKSKIFIPKFYGVKTFGEPEEIKIPKGDNIKLEFNGSLRENQIAPVDACLKAANETGGGILCLGCGFGKCLGIDTPVMMHDGLIKMVQDIKTGDLLMGDDSTPRKVLSTCKGKEQLYKVIPEKGNPYVVNESHILSLKCSNKTNNLKKGDIVDISVKEYLNLPPSYHEKDGPLLGYRVPVNFPEQKINFDPYMIGLWLGNGSLKTELKEQNLINNKHIPMVYKCNSQEIRLKVLAGILDSNESLPGYDIVQDEKLLDDIIFLARSLGFAAYKTKCQKGFYKTTIHGHGLEEIPTTIKRKQVDVDKNVLTTRIILEKQEIGDYYGFEIDGNRRFLLGDFTVTHNTSISLYLISKLGKKALVVVNKEFLMDQWKERIQQFLPDAKIGILRQKKVDIEGKDIVIAMLQSVAMCNYDSSTYDSFDIVFYDEVHCVPSKVFSKALRKINTKYHFGLSATPNRADGMTKVTKLYIGPIIYKVDPRKAKKNPKKLQVFTVSFDKLPVKNNLYRSLKNYQGKPNVVKMISNIIKCPKRLAIMSMILRYFVIKDKRHVLVLSERIQYLRDIEAKIRKDYYISIKEDIEKKLGKKLPTDMSKLTESQLIEVDVPFKIGYYIGGMKEKERKESESADLILASYSMAKEAMDIPILDTLLMATAKSNIEQSVGRIQRKMEYPEDKPPLVIDFVDKFSSFHRQAGKREDFYRKKHYPVTDFTFNDEKSEQLYEDFDEKIKIISDHNEVFDNSEDSEDSENGEKSLPKLVQPTIDQAFYDIIDDGDFDL